MLVGAEESGKKNKESSHEVITVSDILLNKLKCS